MEKIKVLLIDDDEDDYIITKDVFNQIPSRQNYELTWIDNFEKGINAVLKKKFDIYLVDYRLGKYTGVELLNEAIQSNISQPIIILTGKGDYQIDQQAMNIGAADYLVKAEIDPASLDRSLRYALKQSETLKALKESENKFKIIFEKAQDPILISDFTGRVYDVNKAGLSFFNYTYKEIVTINDRDIFYNQEDRDNFVQELETKGAVTDFECELVSRTGRVYFCSLSSFLQIDPSNILEIYHTIIHDLTYRKHIENQSINQGKLTISANIAKSFAEELRNPLSTINLVLDELNSDEQFINNESAQTNLDIIKSNCNRINQLTQNLLLSAQTKSIELQPHKINEVLSEVLADIHDMVISHNITLQKNILPADISINLDKKQLKLALNNLLANAIEAMKEYPKVINISTINDSGHYSIFVEDNGLGVASNNKEKIFEPFFSTKKDANGLGLTEALRILSAHRGSIEFKEQETGSLFIARIPFG